MSDARGLAELQERIWAGTIPLEIRLAPDDCRTYDESHAYMIQCTRLSYLPFLLPRLHAFFTPSLIDPGVAPHAGWFSYDSVPLKWQLPVGLLYDLFSGAEPFHPTAPDSPTTSSSSSSAAAPTPPWQLTLHYTAHPATHLIPLDAAGTVHHDAFVNSVKEADALRNGTAKTIMSMSKQSSQSLWRSVTTHDLQLWRSIHDQFLLPQDGSPLRNVPLRIYLPTTTTTSPTTTTTTGTTTSSTTDPPDPPQPQATLKTIQRPTPLLIPSGASISTSAGAGAPQTLGTALHAILPAVFPSRRAYIHAHAVLHGAVVPAGAPLAELMRWACYPDGWLHVGVVVVG